MKISDFKHRITIYQPNITNDELGQQVEQLVVLKMVWAAIKTVRGSEYFNAAATRNENIYRFIIRYTTGIDPDMQINYKGRIFTIESVINDNELNKTLTIIATEKL